MPDLVTIDITNHIADVRLNRPDKMNALSWDMFEAITAAGKQLAQDRSIRAVVLSGEGRSFCAGMDLENFTSDQMDDMFGPGRGGFWPNYYQSPAYVWKSIPVPVICALHGAAYGGGFQIAMGTDIRIAHPETRLSLMEVKWGLIPDMSASVTLRDLVRLDIAKELTFTGRVVEGEEAQQVGLVTSLSDTPLETALEMAAVIAGKNPDTLARGKYMLENNWHGDAHQALSEEERLQAPILKSPNQVEAVFSAIERREANFSDRAFTEFSEISR